MKKAILLMFVASVLFGCKKDEVEKGSLEVAVSYFYNDFQGYKPDVGAKIYLFKFTAKSYDRSYVDFSTGSLKVEGTGERVSYDFTATANVSGVAKITDIPYGRYLIVAASKGRFLYSSKGIDINSETKTEVKNFGYKNELSDNGEPW